VALSLIYRKGSFHSLMCLSDEDLPRQCSRFHGGFAWRRYCKVLAHTSKGHSSDISFSPLSSYRELAELTFVAVFDRLLRRVLDTGIDACSVDDDVVGKPSLLLTPVALQTGKCREGGR
jgi:hypothetical protein